MGFKSSKALHSIATNFRLLVPIQGVWRKTPKRWAEAFFQARGGKRVILVIGRSERAGAFIDRGFQPLPWRVI